MTDAAIIRLATRTAALEYLLTVFATDLYRTAKVDHARIATRHRKMIDAANASTVPGVGPAMSDHLAAEVQIAVEEILQQIEENLASAAGSDRP